MGYSTGSSICHIYLFKLPITNVSKCTCLACHLRVCLSVLCLPSTCFLLLFDCFFVCLFVCYGVCVTMHAIPIFFICVHVSLLFIFSSICIFYLLHARPFLHLMTGICFFISSFLLLLFLMSSIGTCFLSPKRLFICIL